ncbi:MAG: GIY-YIG nuclease family protein [Phycisphaerales bacterium]
MTKNEIINQIKRIASAEGAPPGQKKFERITKISESQWRGVFWDRWKDAVEEAGFVPSSRGKQYSDDVLLKQCAILARRIGRIPTQTDSVAAWKSGAEIAHWTTMSKRFGKRHGIVNRLRKYCKAHKQFAPVVAMCDACGSQGLAHQKRIDAPRYERHAPGFVYLMKSAGKYKIGKAASVEERFKTIATLIPMPLELIHVIKADDAFGVESFWHRRFKHKRASGEWFDLDESDVSVFKAEGK